MSRGAVARWGKVGNYERAGTCVRGKTRQLLLLADTTSKSLHKRVNDALANFKTFRRSEKLLEKEIFIENSNIETNLLHTQPLS